MQTKDSEVQREKNYAVILSAMRTGSTLLKALLGSAPDVSHLEEINFQKFQADDAAEQINALSAEPVVVMKRPAWFHEVHNYPRLPAVPEVKKIILIRDVYPTVLSCRKMVFRKHHNFFHYVSDPWLVLHYWLPVYERLYELKEGWGDTCCVIRYEDLTADPIHWTAQLFDFLGSEQKEGVNEYARLEEAEWKWGRDDGGPRIQQLKVLPPRPITYEDKCLLRCIVKSRRVNALREKLGYPDLSDQLEE